MKAIVVTGLGQGPRGLQYLEVADPLAGAGEITITVRAAGVNFADSLMLAGKYQTRQPLPFSPGLEVAGVVESVGHGVAGFKPGDRVLAIPSYGGYAEKVAVAADRAVPIPDEMDYVTAAGFPVAYGTSHLGLWHRARLKAGERLLVLGAAGGVGLTAVELGVLMGAEVIAVAKGAEKLAVAAAQGAHHLIDAGTDDLKAAILAAGGGVDVIYDPVGGALFEAGLKAANFEARALIIGFASGDVPQIAANRLLVKNVDVVGFWWGAYADKAPGVMADSFRTLIGWWQAGRLRPHVSDTRPLEQAAEALELVLERRSTGKVVITVG
ncbi:NADPH:quinone oxidoreductase family protein [Zavarzinia compransoris]|uniref:Zinc-binding dehydrogenase n=1 Tax=Zavarzinia compransoris TaxID=1264899 RepID=A0A317DVY1_9PROT|nr:NADPH:quinone oxidoreductase family protein [Zavarzinia compransoris]PWR18848.1 zinc-binding dehydrogenase [Zavarzinia compransoris]TDP48839.1 NADPH2:quinone reductase [Zavarzinia compransoris]